MDIKYQTMLNENPEISSPRTDYIFKLQPLSLDEIVSLESLYNNGNQFPAALRELLYLAGKNCYVLEYGLDGSVEEMQEYARTALTDYGRNFSIPRPFFVLDIYSGSDGFIFVYLDEGINDPMIYTSDLIYGLDPAYPWIDASGNSLVSFIESRVIKLKSGYNPF